MNDLINIVNKDGVMVVSSREVADNFEKRHSDVLEKIEELVKTENSVLIGKYFIPSNYKAGTGKEYKEYLLTKDGFSLLVMGFTGAKALEWKIKYIEAFNQMEKIIEDSKEPFNVLKAMFNVVENHENKIDNMSKDIIEIKDNAPLNPGEYSYIGNLVTNKVRNVIEELGLKYHQCKEIKKELFKSLNSEIKKITGIDTRSQLRQKDFKKVKDFIQDWEPSKATMVIIEQLNINMQDTE